MNFFVQYINYFSQVEKVSKSVFRHYLKSIFKGSERAQQTKNTGLVCRKHQFDLQHHIVSLAPLEVTFRD